MFKLLCILPLKLVLKKYIQIALNENQLRENKCYPKVIAVSNYVEIVYNKVSSNMMYT